MTRTETAIALFNNETAATALVTFTDRKGNLHNITPEGALFKGGAALAGLKDAALEGALMKAGNGRYRAAAEILAAAFPAIGKAADKLIGTTWANKSAMGTLINAVLRAEAGKNGFSKKQAEARMLANALMSLPAFAVVTETETIEA